MHGLTEIHEKVKELVEGNYHHLMSNHLKTPPKKDRLRDALSIVSNAPTADEPHGHVVLRLPQQGIKALNSKQPVYYSDKLIILASFARCLGYEFELQMLKRGSHVITFLRVWNPDQLLESYTLCPGLPFNVKP